MEYKDFALGVAKEAGGIIKSHFKLGMKKSWKSDDTPLTVADTTVNKFVIDSVKKYFPDHSVFGEEESYEVKEIGDNTADRSFMAQDGYKWVCDPIDGTIPFSHGVPTCMFLLALTKDGKPLLGVAYDPFMDRMFFGEIGKGAYLNNERIKVSDQKEIKNGVIGAIDWALDIEYNTFPVNEELDARSALIMNVCSTAYMSSLVACGEFIANIFQGTKGHAVDVAPFKVIIEEAGGKVTDLFGNDQRYDGDINGCVITNGYVHDEIISIIKEKMIIKKQS